MDTLQKIIIGFGAILVIAGLCRANVDSVLFGIGLLIGSFFINPVCIDKQPKTEQKTQN